MNTLTLLVAAAVTFGVLLLLPVGRQVLRSCFTVDPALVAVAPALRNACGIFLALFLAQATGLHGAATPVALGVLLTNLADFSEPYGERLKAMLLTALGTALAVLVGALVAGSPGLHLGAALGVAALVGFAGAIGPRSGLVALFGLALFSLYSSIPVPPATAFVAAGWYLAAGVVSAVVACVAWPLGRYYPTRRKLAVAFRQLAAACAEHGVRRADLRVVAAIEAATTSMTNSRAGEETRRWLEGLLDEVEACRVFVMALDQSKATSSAAPATAATRTEAAAVAAVVASAGRLAREMEHSLTWRHNAPRLQAALSELELACAACADRDRRLVAALGAGLAKAVALLNSRWPIGRVARRAVAVTPGPATLPSFSALSAHFHWQDLHVRHALKFAGTYTVATALAISPLNGLLDGHGFWIPLTVAWICKPDVAGSISRFSMRLCGTVLGVLLSVVLLHFVTNPLWFMALTALAAFLMGAALFANYSLTVLGATVWVLCLSATVGTYTEELADARLLATLLGCGLVLLSAYILPVRSGTAAPAQLAAMSARLRELLEKTGKAEAVALRSALPAIIQRHRLAAVAALAAAEAEPRAPWEHATVLLELQTLRQVLQGLERVSERLVLSVVLGFPAEGAEAARVSAELELTALDQQLAVHLPP